MNPQPTPFILATNPDTADCPCCVDDTDETMGVTTSHPATPLQMEVETVSKLAPVVQPRKEGGVHFIQPGKFQLWNWPMEDTSLEATAIQDRRIVCVISECKQKYTWVMKLKANLLI
jgi:hypothetical protein